MQTCPGMPQELCQTLLYKDYNKGLTLVNPFLFAGVDRAPTQKKNDHKRERLTVRWFPGVSAGSGM